VAGFSDPVPEKLRGVDRWLLSKERVQRLGERLELGQVAKATAHSPHQPGPG